MPSALLVQESSMAGDAPSREVARTPQPAERCRASWPTPLSWSLGSAMRKPQAEPPRASPTPFYFSVVMLVGTSGSPCAECLAHWVPNGWGHGCSRVFCSTVFPFLGEPVLSSQEGCPLRPELWPRGPASQPLEKSQGRAQTGSPWAMCLDHRDCCGSDA